MENTALTLVTGGVRSGKSRFAEELASQSGLRVLYVATAPNPATETDPEMTERIRRHRERRPPTWSTLEEPLQVEKAVREWLTLHEPPDALLLDCLTLLVSNWLLDLWPAERNADEQARVSNAILERARATAGFLAHLPFPVIAVTNEVGWGVVPAHPLGRAFRDLAGLVNQVLAARARKVYVVWAGIPVEIKALDARLHEPR